MDSLYSTHNYKIDLVIPKQCVTLIIIKIIRDLMNNFDSLVSFGLLLWLTVNYLTA